MMVAVRTVVPATMPAVMLVRVGVGVGVAHVDLHPAGLHRTASPHGFRRRGTHNYDQGGASRDHQSEFLQNRSSGEWILGIVQRRAVGNVPPRWWQRRIWRHFAARTRLARGGRCRPIGTEAADGGAEQSLFGGVRISVTVSETASATATRA
jgi:hypothetical protein